MVIQIICTTSLSFKLLALFKTLLNLYTFLSHSISALIYSLQYLIQIPLSLKRTITYFSWMIWVTNSMLGSVTFCLYLALEKLDHLKKKLYTILQLFFPLEIALVSLFKFSYQFYSYFCMCDKVENLVNVSNMN